MSPPVSDSATPKVRPRATSRSATATSIDSSSTPKTMSPRRSSMARRTSASSLSSSAVTSSRVRARAVMRTLIPSIPEARKASVTPPVGVERVDAVLEGLGQAGFARPPGAQHPAGDDARLLARLGHAGAQVGQDAALEHLGHLVGDARDGVDDLVPDRADRGPVPCRPPGGWWRHPGARRPGARCWPTWSGLSPRRTRR